MNPHNHPPKIKSVAMDQLPTPRTDAQGYRKTSWVKRSFARTLERELLASQARERVMREAIQKNLRSHGPRLYADRELQEALNHP